MVRLIVSDLDGTIVPEGTFDINGAYDKILSKLIDKGVNVIIASGRHYNNMKKLLPLIKDKAYFASDNGATLVHKGEVLLKHHLDKSLVETLVDYLHDEAHCEVAMSNDIGYYTEERDEYINNNIFANVEEVGYIVKSIKDHLDDVTKLTVMTKDPIDNVTAPLREKYKNELSIVQSGSIWFDVTKKGINKGEAVKFVQQKLGIKKEETIGFGNSENDISLLNECGIAYVVEDSNETVKSHATHIVPDVFNDGVLKVLEDIYNEL